MGRSINALPQFTTVIQNVNWNVWFSYGEKVPNVLEDKDFLFWGAGKYAASVKNFFDDVHFQSPGSLWLTTLPTEFLNRQVYADTFRNALTKIEMDEKVWFKFAEMKHEALPAKTYLGKELQSLLLTYPEFEECWVQWTKNIMNLNYEHRFFISEKNIVTGSPYLMDGTVYNTNISWNKYDEALKFASTVVSVMAEKSPQAYVLDVAYDVTNANWVVVEANRVWSSGIYGSDVNKVMEALKVSMQLSLWEWVPDYVVSQYANSLVFVNSSEYTSGLLGL